MKETLMAEENTFNKLGFSDKVLSAIKKKGFEEPTAIQAITIPIMLRDDTNIIAQAQTGTGKTAAFGLPLMEMIKADTKAVQALILVPTRELAIQVSEEINSFKADKSVKVVPIYGGQSIDQQLRRLKKGIHIVIGTPGRVIDHLNRRTLKLGEIEHLIIDEADEMLNMGFIEDLEEIMKHTGPDKRTLLFSATMPRKIKELAKKYMNGYEFLSVKRQPLTTNLTEQIYFEVKASDKFEALCRIIDIEEVFYAIIFCRTKLDVDAIANHLIERGYDADEIHGDITQAQRERTLDKFKKKRINILVATDVAARGLDVANLTHVINYSLPQDPESYVHRIGRTGRAGQEGTAITFITPREYKRLMFIQRIAKTDIKKSRIPKVKEIIKAKKRKIYDDLNTILENEIDAKYYNWAKKLLEDKEPGMILAAVLNYCFEEEINPDTYGEIREVGVKEKPINLHGKARLFVALGKKDKMNAKKLVKLIMGRVDVKPKHITDIQVMDKYSLVTVPFKKAEKIVAGFKKKKKKGRKPLIRHARDKH